MTMTSSTTIINNNQRRQALCNLPCLFAFPPSANKQHPAQHGIDDDAINHNNVGVYKMQQYEHDMMKTAYMQINWFVRRLSLMLDDVLQKEEEEDGSSNNKLHCDKEDPDTTGTSTTKQRRKRFADVIGDLFGKQHMKMLMVANANDSIVSSSQQQQQSRGTARRECHSITMCEWTIFDVQQLANKMASWDESLLGGGEGSFSLIVSTLLESILSSQSNQVGEVGEEEGNNPNRASNKSSGGADKDKEMMQCWKSMLHEYGSTSSSSTDAYNGFNSSSISSSSSFSFEHVLSMPLFHAASQIMKSYNNNNSNNNNRNHEDEDDDSTTNRATPPPPATTTAATRNDQDTSTNTNTNTMIPNYLQYQAACIHDQLHYFILPSLQTKLLQQQEQQQPRQQTRVKQLDQLYNTAFESWDDYCLTVLGVSSDVLPLFPQNVSDCSDSSGRRSSNHNHHCDELLNSNSVLLDDYARNDVAKCVFEPMRKELRQLSERFLQSLLSFDTTSAITTKTNDYQNVKGGGGGDGLVMVQGNIKAGTTTTAATATNNNKKCFVGRDIANAIVYYRQFTKFIATTTRSGSGDKKKGGSNEDEETRGGLDDQQLLSTLFQFATSSTNSSSSPSLLVSQFITSPTTRVNLVSDLQQLEVFLSTRKRELSTKSSASASSSSSTTRATTSGRDVVDAMQLQWTQYCIQQQPSSAFVASLNNQELSASMSTSAAVAAITATIMSSLESLSVEDVTRYYNATHSVCMQIVGDSLHAKRLRFLADTVGNSPFSSSTMSEEDGMIVSVDKSSMRFQSVCKRAACLAYQMTFYQDLKDEAIAREIVLKKKLCCDVEGEIACVEGRMKWIRDGLEMRESSLV